MGGHRGVHAPRPSYLVRFIRAALLPMGGSAPRRAPATHQFLISPILRPSAIALILQASANCLLGAPGLKFLWYCAAISAFFRPPSVDLGRAGCFQIVYVSLVIGIQCGPWIAHVAIHSPQEFWVPFPHEVFWTESSKDENWNADPAEQFTIWVECLQFHPLKAKGICQFSPMSTQHLAILIPYWTSTTPTIAAPLCP
jgi:hypothetical protein